MDKKINDHYFHEDIKSKWDSHMRCEKPLDKIRNGSIKNPWRIFSTSHTSMKVANTIMMNSLLQMCVKSYL